ncbi:MAG TPA: PDZ domain-containing protein [Acidobacteriota bacterium]|nr:PDZ domain-containing protein [Acidobacteriota bacterium]
MLRLSVGNRFHKSLPLLLAALASLYATGSAMPPDEDQKASKEQVDVALVRLVITTETRGASESIEINGKRIPDYHPTIIQVFPSTGIVMDDQGHVLTLLGYRWVDMGSNKPRVDILTNEGQKYKGKLIGIDQSLGVAVVKPLEGKLKPTPLCLRCEIRDGTTVMTPVVEGAGFPQFEEAQIQSVGTPAGAAESGGWVVTVNRPLPGVGEPILNTNHHVLGFIASQRPSNDDPMGMRTIVYPMSQLLSLAEKIIHVGGDICTGWLGINIDPTPLPDGILVTQILEDGPAQRAGLAPRDIIQKWNGSNIQDARQLIQLVQNTEIGSKVSLQVFRQGKTLTITPLIQARKQSESPGRFVFNFPGVVSVPGQEGAIDLPRPRVGIETVQLTRQLADFLQMPGQSGLLVLKVDQRAAAHQAGVMVGDVILAVDGEHISDPQVFSSHIQSRGWGGRLILKLLRKGVERTLTIHLPKLPSSLIPNKK